MKIQNIFLSGIAGLMLAASAANAQSNAAKTVPANEEEDEAILFKIHDVKPVKSSRNGDISACEFYVTFYNRTSQDLNSAQLDLLWVDDSLIDIIAEEREENAEKNKNGEKVASDFSYTQSRSPLQLTVPINVPALKSHKQVTLQPTLKSDRCYILLNKVSLNIRSCAVKQKSGSASLSTGNNCKNLFRFVSQENPEYYTDFKPVSYEKQKNSDMKLRANQENEMEEEYRRTMNNLESLSKTLSEIQ